MKIWRRLLGVFMNKYIFKNECTLIELYRYLGSKVQFIEDKKGNIVKLYVLGIDLIDFHKDNRYVTEANFKPFNRYIVYYEE